MNQRVTRQEWLEAALQALAEGGVPSLAVDALARRLGVTKGSFYHHFDSVDQLLDEVLRWWEEAATDSAIRELDDIADPAMRLERLFQISWDRREHLKAEAALLAAATAGDARIRPRYLRVNQRRLAYTRRLYRALGLTAAEAQRFAITAYGSYLGTLQLLALDTRLFGSAAELRTHVAHLVRSLIPTSRL